LLTVELKSKANLDGGFITNAFVTELKATIEDRIFNENFIVLCKRERPKGESK